MRDRCTSKNSSRTEILDEGINVGPMRGRGEENWQLVPPNKQMLFSR